LHIICVSKSLNRDATTTTTTTAATTATTATTATLNVVVEVKQ